MAELRLVRTWTGASLREVPLSCGVLDFQSLPLGTVMVALVDVIRLVHMLLPVPVHLRCGTLFLPRPLNPRDETANRR